MTATQSLIYQMAVLLREAGADLTDERACMRVLVGGRFRGGDIAALIDEAMAAARETAVAVEMARG